MNHVYFIENEHHWKPEKRQPSASLFVKKHNRLNRYQNMSFGFDFHHCQYLHQLNMDTQKIIAGM